MNEYAIDIQNLSKQFNGNTVVDQVSLQIKKGSVFGFLGSNGSGKTTMIRMICGLLTPTSGSGRCLGYDIIRDSTTIKLHIGYMPQKFSLYSGLTIAETLAFFANIYGIENPSPCVHDIMHDLELKPFEHTKAGNLSGGWKQRLSLACCLLHKPQLLFLDEPTAGVDPKARKDFWNFLHKIAIRDQTTILVTTHYMDEAEKCTDLAYINLGKLLYSGTTEQLIPCSKVKAYIVQAPRDSLQALSQILNEHYPRLLISLVNNQLRISSRDVKLLNQFIAEQHTYTIQPDIPTFEEVFIGLMR